MINHIENYLDWLRKNMKEEVIKKGLVEITMPFWTVIMIIYKFTSKPLRMADIASRTLGIQLMTWKCAELILLPVKDMKY